MLQLEAEILDGGQSLVEYPGTIPAPALLIISSTYSTTDMPGSYGVIQRDFDRLEKGSDRNLT